MEILQLVSDVGFPIAAAIVGMYFVFLTQKFLLDNVLERIKGLIEIIQLLEKRITHMSQDIIKIDKLLAATLGLPVEKHPTE
jgi:hypothetical protein